MTSASSQTCTRARRTPRRWSSTKAGVRPAHRLLPLLALLLPPALGGQATLLVLRGAELELTEQVRETVLELPPSAVAPGPLAAREADDRDVQLARAAGIEGLRSLTRPFVPMRGAALVADADRALPLAPDPDALLEETEGERVPANRGDELAVPGG